MSNQNICNICGANYEYIAGRWKCPACGAYKAEELSNEEVTLLYNAAQKLRLCDFNEAENEYADIIDKFPNNPEGYWGRLLARYGIKYEEDFDGRRIPTCYAASIKSVFGDPDYEKAMSLFPEADRAYYKAQAEYIERVRKEWIEKASKEEPYDIFLCYKDSDLANGIDRTPDSIAVQDLYIHLTEQGYRVFYSRESLRDKVGEKYEPYIFNALSTAKVMLVYGSKPEYITSTWLKNEWTRYIKRIQAGEKLQNSLLVVCDGFSPDLLPSSLSSRQCFDATKRSFYIDLDKALVNLTKNAKELLTPVVPPYEVKKERNESKSTDTEAISEKDIDNVLIEDKKSNKAKILLLLSLFAIVGIVIIFFLIPSQNKDNNKNGTNDSPTNESTYSITYYLNGGTNHESNPKTFEKGSGNIPLYEPKRTNYVFKGWYSTDDFENRVTSIDTDNVGDLHLYAKWEKASEYYLITYYLDGGTNHVFNPTGYTETDSDIALGSPSKEGYNFLGWYSDVNFTTRVTTIYTNQKKHISLYAKWEVITKTTYTVTYYLNGGTNSSYNPTSFTVGTEEIPLFDPTKANYKFGGWYSDAGFRNKVTSIDTSKLQNLTLYAKWETLITEAETYTITYVLNGGTNNSQNPKSYSVESTTVTLADPTKAGYGFVGWYSDSGFSIKVTSLDTTNPKNITLYAKWEQKDFVITYNLNGGTNNAANPSGFEANSGSIVLADPTRNGCNFKGWYTDADFNTGVTVINTADPQNVTLYAKWELVTYSILYVLNGGTNSAEALTSYTIETRPMELASISPSKAGYDFAGWYLDSELTQSIFPSMLLSNPRSVTLYAKWAPITYTITYNLNGGTNSALNPSSYDMNSNDITLADPTRSGYLFKGWYSDSSFSTMVTTIDTSKLQYITLYAKWEEFPFTYTISDGEATIIGYTGDEKHIVIPSEINGSHVTAIGEIAFYSNGSVKTVIIPDSIKTIGDKAFSDCYSLTSITIGNNVQTIGEEAFSSCNSLTNVTIPDSVQTIGKNAFQFCNSLVSITIPFIGTSKDDTESAHLGAVFRSKNINSYPVPSSSLKTVVLTGGKTISDHAFYYCESLTSITIPDSVQTIGNSAFTYCTSLTNITIPDSVQTIGDFAFAWCDSLTNVTIPDSVQTIGNSAFMHCTSLTNITIPDSVQTIDDYTFAYCFSLTSVTIPDSVQTIGSSAFRACYSLTGVIFGNNVQTIGHSAFSDCNSLTNVTIPDNVQTIGGFAFSSCYNLANVTLGKNLSVIGGSAFEYCYSLVEVYDLSDALIITKGSTYEDGYVACYALDVYTSKSSPSSVKMEDDGFIFYEKGDARYLLGYVGSETEITLPENCNGKYYEVYNHAFYDCYELTCITIPKTVAKIGEYAFYHCSSLSEIVFENPAGWYYSPNKDGRDGTDIPEANLSTPSVAADIIKNLLQYYLFKNSII